jgi:methionyl-tRNA formyltransferase
MSLRLVFFGTAELACASLRALAAAPGWEVAAVVTQQDKPRGRDLQLQPTPVKAAARELGLPVLQPRRARDPAFIEELRSLQPALAVVVAYGQILPQALLDVPPHGCLNVHTSLLPRHRGAAPIQWAILSGDAETGVTIMKMDAGLDTGPILAQRHTPIAPEDNAQTLHDRLGAMGAELLLETIPSHLAGGIEPIPQPPGETYARKIEKADGLIDWGAPSVEIWRKVRGLAPWPGAFTFHEQAGAKKMLKVWQAEPCPGSGAPGTVLAADKTGMVVACGAGAIRLTGVQPEGRKRMTAQEFLAGHPAPQAFAR